MKVETREKLILNHKEYLAINNALDILCDMAIDSYLNDIANSQLPCGYCVEDIRDGLQYLIDIIEVEDE